MKYNFKFIKIWGYVVIGFFSFSFLVLAGSLIPSSLPSPTTHTLSDIYQKLTNNSYTASIAESFNFPTGEATSTMATVEQIYNLIPTISSSTIATGTSIMGINGSLIIPNTGEVLSGVYFGPSLGLQGTISNKTLSSTTTTVSSGYYATSNLSTVDTDLVSSNIATGTNIFGVVGSNNTFGLTWSSSVFAWVVGSSYGPDIDAQPASYCATLDEGGMPVGTWRLPTGSELIAALSTSLFPSTNDPEIITGLPGGFNSNTKYVSSSRSGPAVTTGHYFISLSWSLSIDDTFNFPNNTTTYVRCVH